MNFWRVATKVFAFFSLIFVFAISAAAQSDSSVYQLQSGKRLRVRMDNEINSRVASENDTFTVRISEPLKFNDSVILTAGTMVEGRVTKVRRASAGGKNGILEVSFETLLLENNEKRKIEGILVNKLKAESENAANVLTIIGATGIGGIVGAVSKADNGALIGAVIGAGAGSGIAFLKKGKDVKIPTDEEFEIELTKTVSLPVRDY